jgi:hypothetical protein
LIVAAQLGTAIVLSLVTWATCAVLDSRVGRSEQVCRIKPTPQTPDSSSEIKLARIDPCIYEDGRAGPPLPGENYTRYRARLDDPN